MYEYDEDGSITSLNRIKNNLKKLVNEQNNHEIQKVNTVDLLPGMFVCELDIPWSSTPFPMEGFKVSIAEISNIQSYCKFVYIDLIKSEIESSSHDYTKKGNLANIYLELIPKYEPVKYKKKAFKLFSNTTEVINNELEALAQLAVACVNHETLNLSQLNTSANKLVNIVINDPHIALWELNKKPVTANSFAMNTLLGAIVAGLHARCIGMPKTHIHELIIAMLMRNIGYMALPSAIRNLAIEQNDENLIKRIININLATAKKSQFNIIVLTTLQNFLEYQDGSGLPNQLNARQIPKLSKIAAIANKFSHAVVPLYNANRKVPFIAMQNIMSSIGKEFEVQIVNEFTLAIGIYPIRSFVKLSTQEIAVVLEQTDKKMFPIIKVVLSKNNKPLLRKKIINLATQKATVPILIKSVVDANLIVYKDSSLQDAHFL